ncbi:MAG: ABC transporter ATP-binding protein [Verrucomicrobia bacterium]|nr:ABC transporter ATP-binding protein [Verrucomicrobiota bacterium]
MVPAESTGQHKDRVLPGAPSRPGAASPLLDIKNLTIEFGSFNPPARAIEGVCLTVHHGETVCLVGESGSGKSVTALSIARLLSSPPARYVEGEIWLDGHEILGLPETELRRLRGRVVSYVFQEPSASLNPVRTIGSQILEALKLHQPSLATKEEVVRLLAMVGIPSPETRADDYPHQMSGGMQQRAAIAMAIASRPKLLVADEPTTALDVTVQAQILDLMRELQGEFGMAILLITHNLGIVREIANRVAVIYAGQIVETAPCAELLRQPRHPYTAALIRAVPELGRRANRLHAIPGQVPSSFDRPEGCRFHPRCEFARPECQKNSPLLIPAGLGHWTRCPWHDQLPLAPLSPDSKA